MSDFGADPLDVADEALAAVNAGRFVVTDPLWRRAVVARAQALVAGGQPVPPAADSVA